MNKEIKEIGSGLNSLSLEYSDYRRGEIVRPKKIIYNFDGSFYETSTNGNGINVH